MLIRAANVDDLSAIDVLQKKDGFNSWSNQQLSDHLQSNCNYVIEVDGQLVGFALFSVVIDEVELLNIVIDEWYQGHGLAQQLVHYCFSDFIKNNVQSCFLEVASSNAPAIRLYEKCQFEKVGLRKNYYQRGSSKEDALIMKAKISTFVTIK